MLPLIPLLVPFVIDGFQLTRDRLAPRAHVWFTAGVLGLLVASPYWRIGVERASSLRRELGAPRSRPIMFSGHEGFLDLVARNEPSLTASDRIETMNANVLRYFMPSDVRVWSLPITEHVDEAYRSLIEDNATYVYCDKTVTPIWKHFEPVVRQYGNHLRVVMENDQGAIYRVTPE